MWITAIVLAIVSFTISSILRAKDRRDDKKIEARKLVQWNNAKHIIVNVDEHTDPKLMKMFYAVVPDWNRTEDNKDYNIIVCRCYFYGDERNN